MRPGAGKKGSKKDALDWDGRGEGRGREEKGVGEVCRSGLTPCKFGKAGGLLEERGVREGQHYNSSGSCRKRRGQE